MFRAFSSASLLAITLLWASQVAAHEGEGPSLEVTGGQILQGEQVELFADELDPHAETVLEISSREQVHPLGVVRTDSQGHITAQVTVPQELPDGYAELRATTLAGTTASLWIHVGNEPDLNQGLPGGSPAEQEPAWTDPSVLVLGIFLVGAGAALLYLLFRPSARRPAGASVEAERQARAIPRKSRARTKPRRA